ncbi:universal stress protein [soil metagenome]
MTIVVGYVPSADGAAALAAAAEEAALRTQRLVVVNSGARGDFSLDMFADGHDLDAVAADLTRRGIEHEIRQPTSGNSPANELLAVAEEVSATMIVIGMRRRSAVGKLILGSTAQTVMLGAGCSVLAVKTAPPA